MELIDRYIYAVTRKLPDRNKGDIEKELRSIIEDMLEQNPGPESPEAKLKTVLQELGDPNILADNYRGKKRHLIGPQLFDKYLLVLKIVIGAVILGISIATLVSISFSADMNIAQALATLIASVFAGAMQAFAWVTIIFTIAEQYGEKLPVSSKITVWSLADLPPIPEKNAIIPRSGSIVSLIFTTIFIIFFWSAIHLVGVHFFTEQTGWVIIPIFDLDVINGFRLLIVGTFLVGVVKEILKLITGRWTLKLSLTLAGLSLLAVVMSVVVLSNPDIWNGNFVSELSNHFDMDFDITAIWTAVTRQLIFVVVLAYLVEITTTLYKGIKYSKL